MQQPPAEEQPAADPGAALSAELGMAAPLAPMRGRADPFRAFRSLRQRNFRLFWFGQMISLVGTYMQAIAQAWLVLQLTHSALQIGIVGALQSLGLLLFSLFGGVFADRWPKQSLAMLQALALWKLIDTGTIQLWHLYILAALLGLTNSFDRPTRQAFVAEMVGREDLPNAIALNSSLSNLTRIIGPSLGGVIIAISGVKALFLLNGLSYLAVLLGLALIRTRHLHLTPQPQTDAGERMSVWRSLGEGFSYIWATPTVSLLIVVVGMVLLFGSNFNVLLPLFATDALRAGASGFGFLSGAFSVGSLLAALWLAWSGRNPTVRGVLTAAVIFCLLEAVFALSRSYPLSLALITSVGCAETAFAEFAFMALQTIAPDHLRGRVMSVTILFFDGSLPLGYLLTGWLAHVSDAPTALLICAALALIVTGAGWLWRHSIVMASAEPAM
jgi:MFS family permease